MTVFTVFTISRRSNYSRHIPCRICLYHYLKKEESYKAYPKSYIFVSLSPEGGVTAGPSHVLYVCTTISTRRSHRGPIPSHMYQYYYLQQEGLQQASPMPNTFCHYLQQEESQQASPMSCEFVLLSPEGQVIAYIFHVLCICITISRRRSHSRPLPYSIFQ